MQLPKSNCSYKDLNYIFILENEQGHLIAEVDTFPSFDSGVIKESLPLGLKENQKYFLRLQVTVNSQTITSLKYIFSELLILLYPCTCMSRKTIHKQQHSTNCKPLFCITNFDLRCS